MFENQTSPQNTKPPIAPPQNPPTSNAPTPKQNKNPKPALIIIGLIFLLTILAASAFWFFYYKKSTDIAQNFTSDTSIVSDDSESTKDNDVDTIITEDNSDAAEKQAMQTEKDLDRMETLIMLRMCYIMKNPEAGLLAPEKWQMDPADLENIDETEREKYNQEKLQFESMCDSLYSFDEEDYDYMGTLLQTDEDEDGVNLYYEKFFKSYDNAVDTDNDGYSDLVEINSNHNPNDTLLNASKQALEEIEELIKPEGGLDYEQALEICDSMEDLQYRDFCYETISEHITDLSFCESVDFYNAASFLDCESNIINNQAKESGDINDCLKLPSYDQLYCFLGFVKNDSDFENCSLLLLDEYTESSFVTCAEEVMGNENFKDKNECYKYKEDLKYDHVIGSCLHSVAINTENSLLCKVAYGQMFMIDLCVESIAKKYDNPDHCINSLLFIDAEGRMYNDYEILEECLLKFVPEEKIEAAAFSACKNEIIKYEGESEYDYGLRLTVRNLCLNELATKFNNESYCDPFINSSETPSEKDSVRGQCYSDIIKKYNREDLCPYIKNSTPSSGYQIQWLDNLKKDGHCLDY